MTTFEENETLTRTGPGTPMGALFRRYWLPVMLASEIDAPDGPPVRVRILSERLVAFRDSRGRVGLMDEFCAHRGVSLWFGRNEEEGLRCPYHGWKYDVSGQCVDVPSEPEASGFCRKIRLTGYPCVERGDVIWAYMGPAELRPPEPAYEWTTVAPQSRHVSKRIQECNYLQALEGGLDSIHSTFLHRFSVGDDPLLKRDAMSAAMMKGDPRPAFIPSVSPGGLHISTRRNVGDDRYFWRVTQFLMPCFNLFPPYGDNPFGGHAFVPMDDERCMIFSIDYHPRRSLSELEHEAAAAGAGIHVPLMPGTFVPVANKANDYLMDRAAQRARKTFSGVVRIGIQDAAVQESMGPIADRSRENLVSTDNGIIMTRKRLLDAARANAQGVEPPGLGAQAQAVRAVSMVTPRDVPFARAITAHEQYPVAAKEAAE